MSNSSTSFSDDKTNLVYLAAALSRYPKVYSTIYDALVGHGIKVVAIEGTKNIWCRDYMPVQVAKDRFVKFQYKSGAAAAEKYGDYPQLIVPHDCWAAIPGVHVSDIVLDGGNCILRNNVAFITEIVFKHNPSHIRSYLVDELQQLLDAHVIIIPVEPGDDLGHADGIIKWIDDCSVFINDCAHLGGDWIVYRTELMEVLDFNGIASGPFPYEYEKCPEMEEEDFRQKFPLADDFNPGFGYYINYLHVNGLILMPQFGIKEDEDAMMAAQVAYGNDVDVVGVDCSRLAMEGGLLNCVTMNYMV